MCILLSKIVTLTIMFIEQEPPRNIELIAKHMGVVYNTTLIQDIADAVDFNRMKTAKHESEALYRHMFGEDFSMYRKGIVILCSPP